MIDKEHALRIGAEIMSVQDSIDAIPASNLRLLSSMSLILQTLKQAERIALGELILVPRKNLEAILPLEIVSGDRVHRKQPGSGQVLNTNDTWAVTQANISGHRLRDIVEELNKTIED